VIIVHRSPADSVFLPIGIAMALFHKGIGLPSSIPPELCKIRKAEVYLRVYPKLENRKSFDLL
jgi:hypothetical protein